jgi:hypothetical protein
MRFCQTFPEDFMRNYLVNGLKALPFASEVISTLAIEEAAPSQP